MLETCSSFFWRMVKTPIGVEYPFLPVETVETPIRLPLRWTWRSCSLIETMIDTGPRGCSSGCQVYWPGFSFRTSVGHVGEAGRARIAPAVRPAMPARAARRVGKSGRSVMASFRVLLRPARAGAHARHLRRNNGVPPDFADGAGMPYIGQSCAMKGPHSAVLVKSEHQFGEAFVAEEPHPAEVAGGSPPIVTYSRRRDEDLPDVYDDGRAEPRFEDEPVAEWDAVEVPPEPPLHARRRARPLVEPVRTPVDEPTSRIVRSRGPAEAFHLDAPCRRGAVAADAHRHRDPCLRLRQFDDGDGQRSRVERRNGTGARHGSGRRRRQRHPGGARDPAHRRRPTPTPMPWPAPAQAPVPVEPPAPRARPEPPASAATAVAPDFDQAAPLRRPRPPLTPKDSVRPRRFRRRRRLHRQDRADARRKPTDRPRPRFRRRRAADPAHAAGASRTGPIPPEDIPMVDGQGQPVTLPNDFLLLDTE